MPQTISSVAFKFSTENFIKAAKGDIFLWTFTFREVIHPKEAMKRWNTFSTRIKRYWPTLGGVRVTEWHPGKNWVWDDGELVRGSHGVHIHLVTDMFLPVHIVRAMTEGLFGRINVVRCDDVTEPARLANYLSKYLTKFMSDRPVCLKGARLWADWGSWRGIKCKDVEKVTPFTVFLKRLRWFCGVGNRYECRVCDDPEFRMFEGYYKHWEQTKTQSLLFNALQVARVYYMNLTSERIKELDYFFGEATIIFPENENEPF